MELLTLCVILNRQALENLYTDKLWPHFIIDMVLLANNRLVVACLVIGKSFAQRKTNPSSFECALFFISFLFLQSNTILRGGTDFDNDNLLA